MGAELTTASLTESGAQNFCAYWGVDVRFSRWEGLKVKKTQALQFTCANIFGNLEFQRSFEANTKLLQVTSDDLNDFPQFFKPKALKASI